MHSILPIPFSSLLMAVCVTAARTSGVTRGRPAGAGAESSQRLGRQRWTVGRTVAWLACCRRLHRRYERKAERFLAFRRDRRHPEPPAGPANLFTWRRESRDQPHRTVGMSPGRRRAAPSWAQRDDWSPRELGVPRQTTTAETATSPDRCSVPGLRPASRPSEGPRRTDQAPQTPARPHSAPGRSRRRRCPGCRPSCVRREGPYRLGEL